MAARWSSRRPTSSEPVMMGGTREGDEEKNGQRGRRGVEGWGLTLFTKRVCQTVLRGQVGEDRERATAGDIPGDHGQSHCGWAMEANVCAGRRGQRQSGRQSRQYDPLSQGPGARLWARAPRYQSPVQALPPCSHWSGGSNAGSPSPDRVLWVRRTQTRRNFPE